MNILQQNVIFQNKMSLIVISAQRTSSLYFFHAHFLSHSVSFAFFIVPARVGHLVEWVRAAYVKQ